MRARRSAALLLLSAIALSGCGWQLRGSADLPFSRIALEGFAPRSPLAEELKRTLEQNAAVVSSPAQAQEVHALIRRLAAALATADVAAGLRILYGGSVKADNIDGLMAQADVDGALVGGASLQAESFARIVKFE